MSIDHTAPTGAHVALERWRREQSLFWPRPLPSRRHVMVLAEDANGACLRPFLALLLDERHAGAEGELVERIVQHARTLEVDPPLTGLDEPMAVSSLDLD